MLRGIRLGDRDDLATSLAEITVIHRRVKRRKRRVQVMQGLQMRPIIF